VSKTERYTESPRARSNARRRWLADKRTCRRGDLHGEQRQLESRLRWPRAARPVARRARRRPLAEDRQDVAGARAQGPLHIVLIEHKIDIIMSVSDRISSCIRQPDRRSTDEIQKNPEVRRGIWRSPTDPRNQKHRHLLQPGHILPAVARVAKARSSRSSSQRCGRHALRSVTALLRRERRDSLQRRNIAAGRHKISQWASPRAGNARHFLLPHAHGTSLSQNAELALAVDTVLERFPALRERSTAKAPTVGGEQEMLAIARALMTGPDCSFRRTLQAWLRSSSTGHGHIRELKNRCQHAPRRAKLRMRFNSQIASTSSTTHRGLRRTRRTAR